MNHKFTALTLMVIVSLGLFSTPTLQAETIVRFDTVLGVFDVDLFDTATPGTVDNFLSYVNAGDYDNALVHRSVPGFVIQGGRNTFDGTSQVEPNDYPIIPIRGQIQDEVIPNTNARGTIAMAKTGSPNSATSQWFFNLDDNSAILDPVGSGGGQTNGGFTAFGQVLGNGMDVVDAIAALDIFPFADAWGEGPISGDYSVDDFNAYEPVGFDDLVVINSIKVISSAPVPEPGTLAIFSVGLLGVMRRRRCKQAA